jgi:hypothetical protein
MIYLYFVVYTYTRRHERFEMVYKTLIAVATYITVLTFGNDQK